MTEAEEVEIVHILAMYSDDRSEFFAAFEPMINKIKRKAWLAGRDAAARGVKHWEDHKLIMALEPPENL